MDITFVYPVRFERAQEGGWVITCRDLPEVVSQAEDDENRIDVAEGALQAAFESRIMLGESFPPPSRKQAGEELVTVPIETATKAALHLVVGEEKPSKSELARRLSMDEKEIRRLMDPYHASKAPRIAKAVADFGYRIQLSVVKVESDARAIEPDVEPAIPYHARVVPAAQAAYEAATRHARSGRAPAAKAKTGLRVVTRSKSRSTGSRKGTRR